MLHTISLVLVFYVGPVVVAEVEVAQLPPAQCVAAMKAVWAAPLPVAFVDENGNASKIVDAWCSEN